MGDPLCERGCGRQRFRHFTTCCTHCKGPDGSHARDCNARSAGLEDGPAWARPDSVPEGFCREGCGRKAASGLKSCCKSCPFLVEKYGRPGHDCNCDIQHDGGMTPPWYWRVMSKPSREAAFHEEVEGHYIQTLGTKLVQQTLPTRRVVKCLRVEDSLLWDAYAKKRAEIRARAPPQLDLKPETYLQLSYSALSTLDTKVNEVWLFHGTSEEAAKSICSSQFRLPTSACHGSLFGKGVYFADRAEKSHQYTTKNHQNLRVIMLCRVILGHVLELSTRTDSRAHETIEGTDYTCVLGCADGTNKEFVVFDVAQVYPEYLMFYSKPGGEPTDCIGTRPWLCVDEELLDNVQELVVLTNGRFWELKLDLRPYAAGNPMTKQLSEVLGLQAGASSAATRRAYHCLALLHHPDKGGDDAVFKAIADAYKALTEAKTEEGGWRDLEGQAVGPWQGHAPTATKGITCMLFDTFGTPPWESRRLYTGLWPECLRSAFDVGSFRKESPARQSLHLVWWVKLPWVDSSMMLRPSRPLAF
ncbi:unnamed protein product [Durusdinium trenchii]|uniref:Poly [ADP-ribose] polymerase n=1 Tax=Durusdinium trenchii TaxID=1381693 RepID=A0ABP0MXW5_9DINO